MTNGRIIIAIDPKHASTTDLEIWDGTFLNSEVAIMPESILKMLPTYSHSNPTGVHQGKVWKRNVLISEGMHMREISKTDPPRMPEIRNGALLCWYQQIPGTRGDGLSQFNIVGRPIQVMDWKKLFNIS